MNRKTAGLALLTPTAVAISTKVVHVQRKSNDSVVLMSVNALKGFKVVMMVYGLAAKR